MDKSTIIKTLREMAKHPTVTLPRDCEALKAAADLIEQAQKQEPDAVQAMIDWYNSGNEDWEEFSRLLSMLTSPPPRQPLTDELIISIALKYCEFSGEGTYHLGRYGRHAIIQVVRDAIEAAHGIKEEA